MCIGYSYSQTDVLVVCSGTFNHMKCESAIHDGCLDLWLNEIKVTVPFRLKWKTVLGANGQYDFYCPPCYLLLGSPLDYINLLARADKSTDEERTGAAGRLQQVLGPFEEAAGKDSTALIRQQQAKRIVTDMI